MLGCLRCEENGLTNRGIGSGLDSRRGLVTNGRKLVAHVDQWNTFSLML